jgi:signal peptidase S26 family
MSWPLTLSWIGITVIAMMSAIAAVLAKRRLRLVRVVGDSMLPTLHTDDIVVVKSLRNGLPAKNNVAVFSAGRVGEFLVKRVCAGPGDSLDTGLARTVAPGSVYLVSDNKPIAGPAAMFGPVAAENLLGVVLFRLPRL